jgi:putative DNA primase/helicase
MPGKAHVGLGCKDHLDVATVAIALDPKARRLGDDSYQIRCPAHDDKRPSCTVRAGYQSILYTCHAGCSRNAIIAAVRQKLMHAPVRPSASPSAWKDKTSGPTDADKTRYARELAGKAKAPGVVVRTYLAGRGLDVADLPADILALGSVKHSLHNRWYHAMICPVRDVASEVVAVNRIYLRSNGEKVEEPAKMTLGRFGAASVHLDDPEPGSRLVVCEGVETGLSVRQMARDAGWRAAVWCALTAGNMPSLRLPDHVREVWIAADADDAGRKAALNAEQRWGRDREVRIIYPRRGCKDFNDELVARLAAREAAE